MQAGVYRMMGQKKKKKLWVLRVTSSKPGAPKPKYLRQLVIDAWEVGALTAFQQHITSRPILTQPVVALKTCIVWLKLLQQGPPEISLESYKRYKLDRIDSRSLGADISWWAVRERRIVKSATTVVNAYTSDCSLDFSKIIFSP